MFCKKATKIDKIFTVDLTVSVKSTVKIFSKFVAFLENTNYEGYLQNYYVSQLWQYGLWSFQSGDTKLEYFLPKNQHTRRKLLNFENWINGEVSKILENKVI